MDDRLSPLGDHCRYTARLVKNQATELHDSTLGSLEQLDGAVVLQLRPAYIHTSDGKPGSDPGKGLVQDADLIVNKPMHVQQIDDRDILISHGSIRTSTEVHDNILPLPFVLNEQCAIHLSLADGQELTINGDAVHIALRGESTYLETYG